MLPTHALTTLVTALAATTTGSTTAPSVPSVRLTAGTRPGDTVTMPAMGCGTFGYGKLTPNGGSAGGEVWNDTMIVPIMKEWIRLGGRRLDGARSYGTQRGMGQAVKEAIAEGIVKREDLFITSKTDIPLSGAGGNDGSLPAHLQNDTGYEYTLFQGHQILNITGLDYVDLLLIHWPGNPRSNTHSAQTPCATADSQRQCRQNAWRALQKLLADGVTRAIGVSNFEPDHMNDVMSLGGVTPGVCQNEFHPYWHEDDLIAQYKQHGIVYQSYSPLGAPDHMAAGVRNWTVIPMDQPTVTSIAAKHDKSPAQVILKWAWQLGVTANPRTKNSTQMMENLHALNSDWTLTPQEMALVGAIKGHGTAPPESCGSPMFPGEPWTCANKVCPDPRAIH